MNSVDTLSKVERSRHVRLIKSRDTKPELLVRRLVWSLGYRYRTHRNIFGVSADLVFSSKRRVIFVHGCFWHRHKCPSGSRMPKTRTKFWKEKFQRNIDRDAVALSLIRRNSWKTLVVWECQLHKPSQIVARVRKFLDA